MSKRCSVACDSAGGVLLCQLELSDMATIAEALTAARALLGDAAADWQGAAVGIHGQVRARAHVPLDGDRIELYRQLPCDPRAVRRERARRRPRRGQSTGR